MLITVHSGSSTKIDVSYDELESAGGAYELSSRVGLEITNFCRFIYRFDLI
jgi:hypothetical protein